MKPNNFICKFARSLSIKKFIYIMDFDSSVADL